MKDFFEKNKVPLTIIIAAFLIAGSIWLSKRPAPVSPQSESDRIPASQQLPKTVEPLQQSAAHIDYTESPNHIGEYACVSGKVDHVYTSKKGNIFINFCSDYKTCPFGAAIFGSDAYKFSNPKQYEGQTVEITGLIKSYQGRPEIVLNDPGQIKIK